MWIGRRKEIAAAAFPFIKEARKAEKLKNFFQISRQS